MRLGSAALIALAGIVLAACTGPNDGRSTLVGDAASFDESPTALIGSAAILDAKGLPIGIAHLRETRLGVRIEVKVNGLPPGTHGIHVHAVGKCEPPEFTTAGGHFNPSGQQHGVPGAPGAHAGDLTNLEVGQDGKGLLLFYSPGLSLNKAQSNGVTFGAGTAIVVHKDVDDHHSQPAGNSGPRLACGVIKVTP